MPPLLIDMSQMIDLALGTPEVGVVNYNVLHALLHIMVNYLDLSSYRVEFRGSQSSKIEYLIKSMSRDALIEFAEYEILDQEGNKGFEKRTLKKKKSNATVDRIIVVQKTNDPDNGERALDVSRHKKPPPGFPLQPISVVSQEDFRKLTDKVNSIHDVVSNTLPGNQEVLRGIRSDDNLGGNPLNEMWNLLNMTKRIDAIEIGMEKLTTIINDLATEYRKWEKTSSKFKQDGGDIANIKDKLDEIERVLFDRKHHRRKSSKKETDSKGQINDNQSLVDGEQKSEDTLRFGSTSSNDTLYNELDRVKSGLNNLRNSVILIAEQLEHAEIISPDIVQSIQKESDSQSDSEIISTRRKKNRDVVKDRDETCGKKKSEVPSRDRANNKQTDRKLQILDGKMNGLEKQVFDLQKNVSDIMDKIEDFKPLIPEPNDEVGVADLYNQLNGIKDDLNAVIQRTGVLVIENDMTGKLIKSIDEKTDELKILKADREEIEELLAEKADYNMLQTKVSIDQFDATKRDLSKGLFDAIGKLTDQEYGWQSSIREIQLLIDAKLNKEEISPLREYMNGKLHALQERLKALAALRRDPEAAGTKTRFLRNVDCLSCNQNVIMKMHEDQIGIPKQDKMLPVQSMRPFLSYQLDNVRQEIYNLANSRNMHHFELLTKEKSHKDADHMKNDSHLCSRYCGGSHTTITAQDRILRSKFPKDKKENFESPEYLIKGNNGTLYKGSAQPCICKPCTPKGGAVQLKIIDEPKEKENTKLLKLN